jgi:hypothetical protein
MADQLEKIRSLNRVASCQHEDWNLQGRDLVNQMFTLIFLSSMGFRSGWAEARQCTQAKSQAWVTSQMAMNGRSLKSIVLICGFMNL